MDLSKFNQRFVIGAVVILLGAAAFTGFALKDHLQKNREQEVQIQLDKKEQQIKETTARVVEAEKKAAEVAGAKMVVENRYQKALERIRQLERTYTPPATTTTNVAVDSDPCAPIVELWGAEREARLACGEALDLANLEISHLRTANQDLHLLSDQKDQKFEVQGEKLRLVTEDRDTQEHRKKLWRGTAVGAIITTLILLL